jgi:hypothetical protein
MIMYRRISDCIIGIVSSIVPEGDIVKKFNPVPKVKPKRRKPSFENKSNRSDYSQKYMEDYRDEGKDYQRVPDKVKEYRREQKKRLEEKFKV